MTWGWCNGKLQHGKKPWMKTLCYKRVKSSPAKWQGNNIYFETLLFFICSIFNKSFVSSSPLHSVLRIIMGKPSAAEVLLPLGKVWLWAAENLTGSTAPAPRECRRAETQADPGQTPQHHSPRRRQAWGLSLNEPRLSAESGPKPLDLEFLFCRFFGSEP